MNLTGLHLLLSYRCNLQCDHCFVWSGPRAAKAAMTLDTVRDILHQARQLDTVEMIFFEGGEPFLCYEPLLDSVKLAAEQGFQTGIVSNGFWAMSDTAAQERLLPLVDAGLCVLQLSSDTLHGDAEAARRVDVAAKVARTAGVDVSTLSTARPGDSSAAAPGSGSVMFRGRAAAKLAPDMARHAWQTFTTCPFENLADPARVHVDPFGYVHLCQGIVMGNLFQTALRDLVDRYTPHAHPIVGPLLSGGPAELSSLYGVEPAPHYADACHLCYTTRLALRARFPDLLTPDQMYGAA